MRMCQKHWDGLRAEVSAQGLDQFISKDGAHATARIAEQIKGDKSAATFDPLLNANFAIFTQALKAGGLYLMNTDKDGNPYCPLCELEKNTDEKAEEWFKGAVGAQFDLAKELGLIGTA